MKPYVEGAQTFERDWWGDCCGTLGEETKQITYANRMGLVMVPGDGHWPTYDMEGKSILDIGGGPVSMMLKCQNLGEAMVVDPCEYPEWTEKRYEAHGINVCYIAGEKFTGSWWRAESNAEGPVMFDECWIYNVLQHVEDPEKVVATATTHAKLVRIFDWLETPPHEGHPHTLKQGELDLWLGATAEPVYVPLGMWGQGVADPALHGRSFVEDFRDRPDNGCDWIAYYGAFPQEH